MVAEAGGGSAGFPSIGSELVLVRRVSGSKSMASMFAKSEMENLKQYSKKVRPRVFVYNRSDHQVWGISRADVT